MKKKLVILGLLTLLLGSFFIYNFATNTAVVYDLDQEQIDDSYELLYDYLRKGTSVISTIDTYYDFLDESKVRYTLETKKATSDSQVSSNKYDYTDGSVYLLEYRSSPVKYKVDVSEAGYYELELDYYIIDNPLTNLQISIKINDKIQYEESQSVDIPLNFEDSTKEFLLDSYNDETVPTSVRMDRWETLSMYDNQYQTSTPLLFYLEAGTNEITIDLLSSTTKVATGNLFVKAPTLVEDYSVYLNKYSSYPEIDTKELVKVNAISYTEKNSSYIRMASLNDELAQPFSSKQGKLNIIDSSSWSNSGQSITYEVEVEKTGLYDLTLHYQNSKSQYNIFRSIYIDGVIPFSEFECYEFDYTSSEYANETLSGTSDYKVFLESGKTHTITIKAESAPMYEATSKLQLIIDNINKLSLEILKITGSDIDTNTSWDITKYIPEIPEYLEAYDILLKDVINNTSQYTDKGSTSGSIAYLTRAVKLLKNISEDPDDLPLYLDSLYSGSSSINVLLGNTLTNLTSQGMALEHIYFSTNNAKLPKENSNIFIELKNTIIQLFDTFFSDKYKQNLDGDVVNVWVSRPMTHINILQRMIDSSYNTTADRKVVISSMPDASKLTLAVAADNAPDVVLGIPSYMPFDLAIRGGVADLTQFDDFYDVAGEIAAPGTILSYVLSDADGDRIYGLPETLNFNLLAYREDIFNSLNISSDLNTWEDMVGILPSLQRYGMNFYMPTSADNSTKWFYQTAPLILQNGGSLYAEDGLSVAINSEEAIKGLDTLTRLYTERSLPTSVPIFYSQFRSGTLPVGIIDFATYLQLKNAAPEITGKWDMKLPLGTERVVNGETIVDRTYISSGTCVAILETANEKEECWEFLKWWLSSEVQTEYGYTLQSTYGPEYLWLSSNETALKESQIDNSDKELIIESLDWMVDIVRNPGQYMVERSLSNVWTATVLSGNPLRVEIENNVITMNRELQRKMQEFGYVDSNGNALKAFYTRDVDWIKELIKTKGGA